jgi:hypothetical protein
MADQIPYLGGEEKSESNVDSGCRGRDKLRMTKRIT